MIESGGENVEKRRPRPVQPVVEPVRAPDGEPMVELVPVDPEIPEEENDGDIWDPADHDPQWPWGIDIMPRTRMQYEFGAL